MQDSAHLMQVLRKLLSERVEDAITLTYDKPNRLELVYSTTKRDNLRNTELVRWSAAIYDSLKKQTPQSMMDVIKHLMITAYSNFKRMQPRFEQSKLHSKSDYLSLIELYRQYFLFCGNIKMINRLEELQRNKSLKKPIVLNILCKYLIQTTKQHFQDRVNIINQCITNQEVQSFHQVVSGSNLAVSNSHTSSVHQITHLNLTMKDPNLLDIHSELKLKLRSTHNRFFFIKRPDDSINNSSTNSVFRTSIVVNPLTRPDFSAVTTPTFEMFNTFKKNYPRETNQESPIKEFEKSKRKIRKTAVLKPSIIQEPLDKLQLLGNLYGILEIQDKPLQLLLKPRNEYSVKFAFLQSKLRNKEIIKQISNRYQRRKFVICR